MRELFIEELEQIVGGAQSTPEICKCCLPTTLACCEEGACSTCCD
jgi:hypothetical protein